MTSCVRAESRRKHTHRVRFVARFAENLPVDDYDRVRTQHEIVRAVVERSQRLLPRQAFGVITAAFFRSRHFRNIRWMHNECNTGVAQ